MPRLPDDPAARQQEERMLAVIDTFDRLRGECRLPPQPHTDLATVDAMLPDAPTDIITSVVSGLEAAVESCKHVRDLFRGSAGFAPIVPYTLLRTALLGAARVVFIVAPASLGDRHDNALLVLRQESASLRRGLQAFDRLEELHLQPDPDDFAACIDLDRSLNQGNPPGEAKTLERVAAVAADILFASDPDIRDSAAITHEEVVWMWHTYSGVAHGFGWPHHAPTFATDVGCTPMPGDLYAELGLVVPLTQLALEKTIERTT